MKIGPRTHRVIGRLVASIMPRTLFLPGLPDHSFTEVDVEALPIGSTVLKEAGRTKGSIRIVLDPSLALVRQVELPKAAAAKAEAAISLQLRQTLPNQAQGLLWRSAAIGQTGDRTIYSAYVVKQSAVDYLLSEFLRLGKRVEAITFKVPGLAPIWENAPASRQSAKNWAGFSALCVVFVVSYTVFDLLTERNTALALVDTRAGRVADLEDRVAARRQNAGEEEKAAIALQQDLSTFVAESRRLRLLTDLTDVLPDTVWVSELSVSGDRMVVSGFSVGDVADVIDKIQRLPWAQSVQLNGAISFDSYSAQNRFELGLLIKMDTLP